jgi:hypothetical protein
MRIKLEDYFGNDICEIKIKSTYHTEEALHNIIETDEYNIADVDEDNEGEYIRLQLTNSNKTIQ